MLISGTLARTAGRVFVLLTASTLLACAPASDEEAGNDANTSIVPKLPKLPVAEPPIDRERLILEILRAASRQALGLADAEAQRQLDGKRFEIRVRFGCGGPSDDDAKWGWTVDEEENALRIRVTPDLGDDDPIVEALVGEGVETVEGFWLPKPWLLAAQCPAAPAPAEPTQETEAATHGTAGKTAGQPAKGKAPEAKSQRPAAQGRQPAPKGSAQSAQAQPSTLGWKIGIAQFFTDTDPRTRRRSNRPYESVTTLPPDKQPGAQGFDLLIAGRLRAVPGGGVILCEVRSPAEPPPCIVSVDVDRVQVEWPDTKTVIDKWGVS